MQSEPSVLEPADNGNSSEWKLENHYSGRGELCNGKSSIYILVNEKFVLQKEKHIRSLNMNLTVYNFSKSGVHRLQQCRYCARVRQSQCGWFLPDGTQTH